MQLRWNIAGAADFQHERIFHIVRADRDPSRAIADAVRRDSWRGIDRLPVPARREGGTPSYFTMITVQGDNLVRFWEVLPQIRSYRLESPMKPMTRRSNFPDFAYSMMA